MLGRTKLVLPLLAVCVFALALAVGGASAAKPGKGKPRVQKVSLLYVLDASSGSLRTGAKKGTYKLTLAGLARNAVWFSDRPARRSGAFPSRGIADAWKGFGFAADPPNAALVFADPSGAERTAIFALSRPRYLAKGRKLTFSARSVGARKAGPNLALHARAAAPVAPGRFGAANLFVDNGNGLTFGTCLLEPFTVCETFDLEAGALFEGIDLRGAKINNSALPNNNFNKANLEAINLSETYMSGSSFVGANLRGAILLGGIEWLRVNLSGANLTGAQMNGAQMFESTFANASMAGVDLSGAELQRANFEGATLVNADLGGALMYNAKLWEANLRGANLSGVNLENASFYNTTMPDGSSCTNYEGPQGCSLTK